MKKKGNKAELEVARILEPWWRQLEPEATFVRTPRSGGWTQGRDLFDARGDLMVKGAPRFPFLVEVKRREKWSLENFEEGKPCPVWGWWVGACRDAEHAKRRPMLWTRHNRREWIVLVPETGKGGSDFVWGSAPAALIRARSVHPMGFWADRFLATHPRRWT